MTTQTDSLTGFALSIRGDLKFALMERESAISAEIRATRRELMASGMSSNEALEIAYARTSDRTDAIERELEAIDNADQAEIMRLGEVAGLVRNGKSTRPRPVITNSGRSACGQAPRRR